MKQCSIPALAMMVLAMNFATARADTVTGRVTDVRPEKKEFTIRLADDDLRSFRLDDRSKLQLRGGASTIAEVKPGMILKVTYEKHGAQNVVQSAAQPVLSTDEIKRQLDDLKDKKYGFQNKDQYVARLQGILNSMEDQIEDLRQRARTASGKAKVELMQEIAVLEMKREELQARMPTIRRATAEAWNDLKQGVGQATDDFQKAWEKARSRFKDKDK